MAKQAGGNAYDVTLTSADGGTEVGLMLAKTKGTDGKEKYLFRVTEVPYWAQRTSTGEISYSDIPPERETVFAVDDLSGGCGLYKYKSDDKNRYFEAHDFDARFPNQGILGPAITTTDAVAVANKTWVAPTSVQETGTGAESGQAHWSDDASVYDGSTATFALNTAANTGNYLQMDIASMNCDKVRIYCSGRWTYTGTRYVYSDPTITLDVYYAGGWHNIYTGTISKDTWVEMGIGTTYKAITAARVKNDSSTLDLLVYEFNFGTYASETTAANGDLAGPEAFKVWGGELFCIGSSTAPAGPTKVWRWDAEGNWCGQLCGQEDNQSVPGSWDISTSPDRTLINLTNPITFSGYITSVEIDVRVALGATTKVGIFTGTAPNFVCRSVATIGAIAATVKPTVVTTDSTGSALSLLALQGDYIGIYTVGTAVITGGSGGGNIYWKVGDNTDGGSDTYALYSSSVTNLGIRATGTIGALTAQRWEECYTIAKGYDSDKGVGLMAYSDSAAGTDYLIAYHGAGYDYTSAKVPYASNWTAVTPTKNTDYMQVVGDTLYSAHNNIVYASDNPTSATNWDTGTKVGNKRWPIHSLHEVENTLLCGRRDGLYSFDSNGNVVNLLPMAVRLLHPENFKYGTMFNNAFIINYYYDGVYHYYYGPTSDITPAKDSEHMYLANCPMKGITAGHDFVYAMFLRDEETKLVTLCAGRENGDEFVWHPLRDFSVYSLAGLPAMYVCMRDRGWGGADNNPRLWIGESSATVAGKPGYISLTAGHGNPQNDSICRFVTAGSVITPWYDAGLPTIDKGWIFVEVGGDNLSANRTITVSYEIDNSGAWTALSTVATSDGITAMAFPSDTTGKQIRFKIALATNTSTQTPVVQFPIFTVHHTVRPKKVRQFEMAVNVTDYVIMRDGQSRDDQTASEINTTLATLRAKTYPLTFKDWTEASCLVQIVEPKEEDWITKEMPVIGTEKVISLKLVEILQS
jgi:hypothetical protein